MKTSIAILQAIANQIRRDSIRSTTAAGSGHPTSCASSAEIMATLFFRVMKYNAENPKCPLSDRFVLSKGHAAPALYACWKIAGFLNDFELMNLRKQESIYEGHPTPRIPFVDIATGSLGQGLSAGIGMALNASKLDKTDYRTYVLMGDGETAEGSVWEAAQMASFYKIDNLCAIVDLNRLGQSQATMLEHDTQTAAVRWQAFGWNPIVVDGHSCEELLKAFDAAANTKDMPTVIIARTLKGKGIAFAENRDGWHGKPLSIEQEAEALVTLPELTEKQMAQIFIDQPTSHALPHTIVDLKALKPCELKPGDAIATREQYGNSLAELGAVASDVVVLDAETKNSTYSIKFMKAHPDRFIECFIAEQNMIGVACGLASRGKVPFLSSFAAFLSRGFDQTRMAGISGSNIKLCGSHSGISIGEDGPSQMALEDIAFFRTVPECVVLYPSDGISANAAVRLAYEYKGMIYLRSSRPKTPVIYENNEEFVIGQSKIVRQTDSDVLTIVGAGVTVFEALKAADMLAAEDIAVRVVDIFSVKPLDKNTLKQCALATNNVILTVEDHYEAGGIGEAIAGVFSEEAIQVHRLFVPKVAHSGKPAELLAWAGIDAESITKRVKEICKTPRVR